ncbi:MAG: IS66 family transposase [Eubacteriales bacterium]|nr:IS66 family transposase [Eubacteriales bacterium]
MDKVTISREEYTQLLELSATVKSLQNYVCELENTVNFLKEGLRLSRERAFGSSSEKLEYLEQLTIPNLFDEMEALSDPKLSEPKLDEIFSEVKSHKRRKKVSLQDSLPEDLPVIERHHSELPGGQDCPQCGHELVKFGSREYKHLLLVPSKAVVIKDITDVCKCVHCEAAGEKTVIVEASCPPSVIPGSIATAEAIAQIATEKFVQATPLYRQEQYWERFGVKLSRQTMSNWLLRAVEDALKPVYENMCGQLVARDVLHADESPLQVLREEGKSPQSKSYMWLYRTSGDSEDALVLYQYERDRKQIRPRKFLTNFRGYLHCDGYSAYHSLAGDITCVGCWSHLRRKFIDARKALGKSKTGNNLLNDLLSYIEQLFMFEKILKEKPPDERQEERLLHEKPIAEKFFQRLSEITVSEKSALGRAVAYALGQKEYLMNFFLDGRLELTNNRAERSIKPFVIGRKNFLFANTPRGAEGSSIYYSLVETCKENSIDPYAYLVYTLKQAAIFRDAGKQEDIAGLTPAYFKKLNSD